MARTKPKRVPKPKKAPRRPKRGKSATTRRKPPVGTRTRTRKSFAKEEHEL
jgi:hypothetical protein